MPFQTLRSNYTKMLNKETHEKREKVILLLIILLLKRLCWKLKRAIARGSHQRCSLKINIHKNFTKFTGKHFCQSFFFNKKDTLAQVFSSKFCEIFKNTFFKEHLRWLLLISVKKEKTARMRQGSPMLLQLYSHRFTNTDLLARYFFAKDHFCKCPVGRLIRLINTCFIQ